MATPLQLTPQQLQKLADLYARIDGLSASAAQSAAANAQNIGNAVNELVRLEKAYSDLMKDINSTREAFAHIVDDINGMSSGANRATKAFRGLESLAAKLQSHQSGINDLSSKELQTLQKKTQNKKADLDLAKKLADEATRTLFLTRNINASSLEAYRKALASSTEIGAQIRENDSALNTFNEQLQVSISNQQQIEKSLGVTGALMKGMSKIPFLGDLPGMSSVLKDVEDDIKEIEQSEGRIVGKSEAMAMAFKKMGPIIKDALTDPLVLTAITTKLLVNSFKMLFEIGMKADAEITNLSKSMAISKEQATAMRDRFKEIQDAGNNIYETTTNLVNAQLELASAFGATAGFSEQQLKDQILLTKQMGFSVEEAQGLQQLSMANGMTAKDVTNSVIKQTSALAKQTGVQLDNKKVIGEVAKVSGQLRLQYQNNPALIAAAVVQTQKLGISLDQAAKSSRSLLDFESSISNELEAELLTGKDLNLEKARLLALNGDVAASAAEMLKQVGSTTEFSKMNVIQQDALARSVGMTSDELANSLIQQENLNRLGSESRKQIEEKAELLRRNGDIDGANRLMNSIGNEKEAQEALAKISAQETFNASMDKMKAILSSIVDGPATTLVNLISSVVAFATKLAPLFKVIGVALIPVAALLTAMWIKTQAIAIQAAIAGAWESLGPIPLVGAGLAAAAAIAGVGYIMSQPSPAGDMYSPADGKTQVSTKEGGLFELSKNDSLMAFPEKKGSKNQSSGGASIDISPLISQMQMMNATLSRIESKEGTVTMDNNEVGKATNIGTYKVFST
jgi:hypothetical protein